MNKENIKILMLSILAMLACRFIPHPLGFTPMIAVSVFAGKFLGKNAFAGILVSSLIADLTFGLYEPMSMAFNYLGLSVAFFSGVLMKNKTFLPVLSSSALFFALSNFGVFLSGWYGFSAQGFVECYVMAVPFWLRQLTADMSLALVVSLVLMAQSSSIVPFSKIQSSTRSAFTLIELLVVIAIIAVLSAILLPVFSSAKKSAHQTVSISALKQLSVANTLYVADHDDTMMRWQVRCGDKSCYWWGSFDGVSLNEKEGLIYPYIKSSELTSDLTFPDTLRSALGRNGFGYNYTYLSPVEYGPSWSVIDIPVLESQITSPSETLLFASAARINNWQFDSWKLEGSSLVDPPSASYPGVHARHSSERAVTAWADGHAKSTPVRYRLGSFGYGMNSDWFRESSLGDLVAPGCAFGENCQDSLYDLD
jgi:prepilin-type N-terminal cleavage/methylation domain-containing protein